MFKLTAVARVDLRWRDGETLDAHLRRARRDLADLEPGMPLRLRVDIDAAVNAPLVAGSLPREGIVQLDGPADAVRAWRLGLEQGAPR